MDILDAATKIAGFFVPHFKKSKTIKQISKDIGEATDTELAILWKQVKPWFIEEYEEEKPIDDSFEVEDIKALLKSKLKKADATTQQAIATALASKEAQVSDIGIDNRGAKIGQQNISSTVNNTNSKFDVS